LIGSRWFEASSLQQKKDRDGRGHADGWPKGLRDGRQEEMLMSIGGKERGGGGEEAKS
jgi:hypothetical protein